MPGGKREHDPDHRDTRILVAIEPVDLRKGIDGLAQFCREKLTADPFSGCLFIFRSRRGTAIKALAYDGQGYCNPSTENPQHCF